MVRNKANIIVKDKLVTNGQNSKNAKSKLPTLKFPILNQNEYHGSRLLLSDKQSELEEMKNEIKLLEKDMKLM